jgi:plastocyanin
MGSSSVVGAIVAILIIGAVATIGYYQVEVAPGLLTSTSTSSVPSVTCPSVLCVNVTIPGGAGTPPSGWTNGAKTTFGYNPDTITVVVGVNSTIYWVNQDVGVHTVTSDPGAPSSFDSGYVNQGGTYQVTLTVPGTYSYHCSIHAWMQGKIVVLPASSSGSSSSTSSSTTNTATST